MVAAGMGGARPKSAGIPHVVAGGHRHGRPLERVPTAGGGVVRPKLKDVFWERSGAELRLVRDAQEQLRLDDPDGLVELLLDLLCKGSRTPPELAEIGRASCRERVLRLV